ncbi:MAG: MFS transporter [Flavobacteriales bacterium]|nr:MAG: MFS transporter [Flavobacteriales bacterium]
MQDTPSKGSYTNILLLILSGELIYILPYFLPRVFRPTFLAVFDLNNVELGSLFSVYGSVAFFSYIFGGTFADKFLPRKLIATSLILTSLGGFVLMYYPSFMILQILYGYWGFTTVFLFWGAMIKGTRIWGGSQNQGQAFGFLDGGRGLTAALMGSVGVFIFSFFLPEDVISSSIKERQDAFQSVILFSSIMVALIGVLVYFFMKTKTEKGVFQSDNTHSLNNILAVLKLETVWLLMIIILCAYFGYKVTDIYSLYASDVMGYDEVNSANIGSLQLYLRPIACFAIGFLADKTNGISWIIKGFFVMLTGSVLFASGILVADQYILFFISLIILALGTYAIRALYFAILKEGDISLALTGTAVGVISLSGYTPDIFAGPLMGYFLDKFPGVEGHQYVYAFLGLFSIIGLIASSRFARITKKIK